jgi:hypothetical protein
MSTVNVDTINPRTLAEVSIPTLDKRMAAAWVNFNGTGVVTIRDSYNVSSVADNGVGDYTVNFTIPFADNNYCLIPSGGGGNLGTTVTLGNGYIRTSSSCNVNTYNAGSSVAIDSLYVDVVAFSN